jgi:hypothetical protein
MRLVALSLVALSSTVLAQGFELDLTDPEVPAEFRPSVGVLSVTSGEAAPDAVIDARARQLEAELLKATTGNAGFGKVSSPQLIAGNLGAASAASLKCADYACLAELARTLKIDRLIKGVVTKSGAASLLTLYGYDGALPELVIATVESNEKAEKAVIGGFAGIAGKSQAVKDREFVKKAIPVFFEVLEKIKTPNGKILVDSAEASAVTTISGQEGGIGSFDKIVQRGSYDVKVTAAGYNSYEQHVTVEPLKTETVKVVLVAREIQVKPVIAEPTQTGTPRLMRPGLYIAIAGLIVAGVGVALGVTAKGTESRAVADAQGVVPITRAAAKSARTNALLFNVLVPVGAVMVAGGGVWFFLTPGVVAKKKTEEAPPAENTGGGGFGAMVGYSGTF